MIDQQAKSLQCSVNGIFGTGKYKILEEIKRGADGLVYKISFQKENRIGALKVLPKKLLLSQVNKKKTSKSDENLVKKAQNQIEIHSAISSGYVVKLYNNSQDDMYFYLILEYIPKGDLGGQIAKNPQGITFSRIRTIGNSLAKAIDTIHKKSIVHRDIKPENILLTEQDEIKLCDFSCAAKVKWRKDEKLKDPIGTLQYMAPQMFGKYNNSVDIWSYGCVLYQMAMGNAPFSLSEDTLSEYKRKINKSTVSQLRRNLGQSIRKNRARMNDQKQHDECCIKIAHLLLKIFEMDVQKRWRMSQIITHPFFTDQPLQKEPQEELVEPKQKDALISNVHQSRMVGSIKNNPMTSSQNESNKEKNQSINDSRFKKTSSECLTKTEQVLAKFKEQNNNLYTETYTNNKNHSSNSINVSRYASESNGKTNNENANTLNQDKQSKNGKNHVEQLMKYKLNNNNRTNKFISDGALNTNEPKNSDSKYVEQNSSHNIRQPLNCQGMFYKARLEQQDIIINEHGIRAQYRGGNKKVQISPKGKNIRLYFQGIRKDHRLQSLPKKYIGIYNFYRQVIQVAKNEIQKHKQRESKAKNSRYDDRQRCQGETRICRTSREKLGKNKQIRESKRVIRFQSEDQCRKQHKQRPVQEQYSIRSSSKGSKHTRISAQIDMPLQLVIPSSSPSKADSKSSNNLLQSAPAFIYILRITRYQPSSSSNSIQLQILNYPSTSCSMITASSKLVVQSEQWSDSEQVTRILLWLLYSYHNIHEEKESYKEEILKNNANAIKEYVRGIKYYCKWLCNMPSFSLSKDRNKDLNGMRNNNRYDTDNYQKIRTSHCKFTNNYTDINPKTSSHYHNSTNVNSRYYQHLIDNPKKQQQYNREKERYYDPKILLEHQNQQKKFKLRS